MKVLITGSNGLLGQKLLQKLRVDDSVKLIATSKGENRVSFTGPGCKYIDLDITDSSEVERLIYTLKPDVLINTAAITDVDLCEIDSNGQCDAVNYYSLRELTLSCNRIGTHLIHISTDFIFDGEDGPYKEDDKTNPLSAYGRSKWRSERLIQSISRRWTILRTSVVFGVGQKLSKGNFVLRIKEKLEKGDTISVVDDQFRSPTLAEDLADACILAAKKKAFGIFNASGKDIMSMYEMAERMAKHYTYSSRNINRISTAELNQRARRPPRTGFILDKAINELGYNPHSFEDCLNIIDQQLKTID